MFKTCTLQIRKVQNIMSMNPNKSFATNVRRVLEGLHHSKVM